MVSYLRQIEATLEQHARRRAYSLAGCIPVMRLCAAIDTPIRSVQLAEDTELCDLGAMS